MSFEDENLGYMLDLTTTKGVLDMSIISQLLATSYSFENLPIGGKKSFIQYRMREAEVLSEDLIEMLVDSGALTEFNADVLNEQLTEMLESLDENPDLWNETINIIGNIYKELERNGHVSDFKYIEIDLSCLVDYVSSFKDYSDFDDYHQSYIAGVSSERVHDEEDMWSVIMYDGDDYDPIWDGWNRFHCAVRDKRKTISVIHLFD